MLRKLYCRMYKYLHISVYLYTGSIGLGFSVARRIQGFELHAKLIAFDIWLRFGYNSPELMEEFNDVAGY